MTPFERTITSSVSTKPKLSTRNISRPLSGISSSTKHDFKNKITQISKNNTLYKTNSIATTTNNKIKQQCYTQKTQQLQIFTKNLQKSNLKFNTLTNSNKTIFNKRFMKYSTSTITSPQIQQAVDNASVKVAENLHQTTSATDHIVSSASNYQFQIPPTFGVVHEVFPGGRVPDQMPHINLIQDFLNYMHSTIGLPWWGTIAATTVLFRLAVLPLNLSLIRNSSRLSSIRHEIEKLGQIISDNNVPFNDKVDASVQMKTLFQKNKCHPLLNIVSPFIMAPMFLSVFLSVERICLHEPSAATGGLLWFNNLAVIDPTWVLPAASALTWLLSFEMGGDQPRTYAMSQFRSLIRFIAAIMVPITGALPSGVFVYWITSNLFTITQIKIVQNPKVRAFLRIPPKPKGDDKAISTV